MKNQSCKRTFVGSLASTLSAGSRAGPAQAAALSVQSRSGAGTTRRLGSGGWLRRGRRGSGACRCSGASATSEQGVDLGLDERKGNGAVLNPTHQFMS
jgi:hypothetical protein